ncbi:uncharacterized protein METZ01_LOCUS271301, partial [marine metagenome]
CWRRPGWWARRLVPRPARCSSWPTGSRTSPNRAS